MRTLIVAVVASLPLSLMLGGGAAWGQEVKAQDTKGTPDERAAVILKQLTPEEKISLLSGNQFVTHAVARLGIPGFEMSDGPQGVRNGPGGINRACAFPCGAALAATWDVDLATAYGKAMGLEGRARGTNYQLGPGLNICRVPVNGRNFEYFGEDPYLASMMASRWAKACSEQGVVPTIKHFAANDQETNRNSVDTIVDERTMHEIYLPAFKRAVLEGGTVAVMCSYNRLNGSYASNNDWLLNEVLKKTWGFKGIVMSDWGASHQVTDVAKGLDLEMPTGANLSQAKVTAALTAGTVKQADIDNAVQRFLRTAFAMGWMENGWVQKNAALPLDSADSAKTAQDVAESAVVLLKNEKAALPFDRSTMKSIVVVGPNATAAPGGRGGATGGRGPATALASGPAGTAPQVARLPANAAGGGSGAVVPYEAHNAEADYLQGIIKAAGANVKVTYLPMPAGPAGDVFATLANARTAPGGADGLTLAVQVTGAGDPVTIAPSVQTGINATWTAGQLPFGVPAGRDATFTWSGVLAAPADGDFEMRANGNSTITLDGQTVAAGDIVHLVKDKPVAIKVQASVLATPPAGRGGRGGRGGAANTAVQVALVQPAMPDMAQIKAADAVVVCVGLNGGVESEGRDRPFELPSMQQYLIRAAAAANPRTVVINNSGAAVGMMGWRDNPAAILQAWYIGQEGGVAIGRVLFGDVNPSGRLCSTFDKTFAENPASGNYPGTNLPGQNYPTVKYEEGIFYGYRGYDKAAKDPLFPFGYGLSYTTFELSNLKVDRAAADGWQAGATVGVDVKNTGSRAGADVVEIYVGETGCPLPRPVRELKGFAKVVVNPGETKHVQIVLPPESFSYWSPDKKGWVTDAGNTFTIEAAHSERDIKLKQAVTLK